MCAGVSGTALVIHRIMLYVLASMKPIETAVKLWQNSTKLPRNTVALHYIK